MKAVTKQPRKLRALLSLASAVTLVVVMNFIATGISSSVYEVFVRDLPGIALYIGLAVSGALAAFFVVFGFNRLTILSKEVSHPAQEAAVYRSALERMRFLGLSQLLLLKLLAVVGPESQTKEGTDEDRRALMSVFLDQVVKMLGAPHRASVLVPAEDGKYLEYFVDVNMPQHKDYRVLLGDPDREGVAGYAFRTLQIVSGTLYQERGIWRSTAPHYVFREGTRHAPPYRSFVAIPLVDPDGRPLGVVSLDSPDEDAFSQSAILQTLVEVMDGLAAALTIYQQIKHLGMEMAQERDASEKLQQGQKGQPFRASRRQNADLPDALASYNQRILEVLSDIVHDQWALEELSKAQEESSRIIPFPRGRRAN
jgi:GAF domain